MAFDTSIYSQIKPIELQNPLAQAAQIAQLQGAQNQNRLADLVFGEKQRAIAEEQQMRDILARSGGDLKKAQGSLMEGGFYKPALEIGKNMLEQDEKRSTIAKNDATTAKTKLEAANVALTQHRAMLNNVNDPATARQWLIAGYQNPDTKGIFERFGPLDTALQRFDQSVTDPQSFAKWKMGASMNADDLVKYTTPDANTVANNKQSDTNNRRTVAETARGHDLADKRQKDANDINKEAARSQVVETPEGFALVDKGTAQSRPVVATGGQQIQQKDSPKYQAEKLQGQLGEGIKMARELIPKATASGAGALVDSAAGFFGKSTAGADAASQLDTLSGWMTANVPRMQGPQSDRDVMLYKQMAAAVGDRTKPASQRLKALDTLEALQRKYAAINGTAAAPAAPAVNAPANGVKFLGFE